MNQDTEKLDRLSIYLPGDMLTEIEQRAKAQNAKRATYLRDLLSMGLEVERDNEVRGAL